MLSIPSLSSIFDKLFPSALREGTFTCSCGEVQGRISVPASSHVLMEQTSALCHCQDCKTFVEAYCINNANMNHLPIITDNGATHMVNFYKSDICIIKGQDKIRAIRHRKGSPMIRSFCGACGTPLGADVGPAPFTLIYHQLLRGGENSPIYLPTTVLNFRNVPRALDRTAETCRCILDSVSNFCSGQLHEL